MRNCRGRPILLRRCDESKQVAAVFANDARDERPFETDCVCRPRGIRAEGRGLRSGGSTDSGGFVVWSGELQLGQVLQEDAADFEDREGVHVDRAVSGGNDDFAVGSRDGVLHLDRHI